MVAFELLEPDMGEDAGVQDVRVCDWDTRRVASEGADGRDSLPDGEARVGPHFGAVT